MQFSRSLLRWNRSLTCFQQCSKSLSTGKKGVLSGVRVLDLSRILAGPYCTQMLGDMGAEVIKIEQPGGGDETRRWGPPFVQGESSYFMSINRNKKSVAVNLQSDRGRELIYELAKKSDIVVQNFLPGKAAELGVGYEELAAINPRIIYCSISGFGASGPLAAKPGYDLICSAMYGMMHITGEWWRAKVLCSEFPEGCEVITDYVFFYL